MRAPRRKAQARYLALTLGALVAMILAGSAGWPNH
jgi:hypothetical protein